MSGPPPIARRCAVLGSPIGHSLSPALHRAAYAALGLPWTYDAFDVDEAGFAGFLAGLGPEWRGLSLTMPLKKVALPACDRVDDVVSLVGAANTLLLEPDGSWSGTNTDVPGMVAALAERGVATASTALVLGAGATARSAVAALARLGVHRVRALARHPDRAGELRAVAARVGVELAVAGWPDPADGAAGVAGAALGGVRAVDAAHADGAGGPIDVAVSTVPSGAAAPVAAWLAKTAAAVFDVSYDPWPTPLSRAAAAAGRPFVSGLDLLTHQAALQVEQMTGHRPAPVDAMRAAVEAALAARLAPADHAAGS